METLVKIEVGETKRFCCWICTGSVSKLKDGERGAWLIEDCTFSVTSHWRQKPVDFRTTGLSTWDLTDFAQWSLKEVPGLQCYR